MSAKDYVESLHQNNRATLLYGKNNVMVLPVIMQKKNINLQPIYFKFWRGGHGDEVFLFLERAFRTHGWLSITTSKFSRFNNKMDSQSVNEWICRNRKSR